MILGFSSAFSSQVIVLHTHIDVLLFANHFQYLKHYSYSWLKMATLVTCPFNPAHTIAKSKLLNHIEKCRKVIIKYSLLLFLERLVIWTIKSNFFTREIFSLLLQIDDCKHSRVLQMPIQFHPLFQEGRRKRALWNMCKCHCNERRNGGMGR